MLSILRLSHHIRRGKLAQTWTTPKGHATPEAQPPAAGPGKPRQVTTRAPSRRTNTAEKRKRKKNANAGHPAKENKKFSIGSSERIFSLRCLRAQKLARLIEKF
ncbi:hypothetical protein ROSINTL182_05299 [Roseburia intestinalis L1-82]|uniref:Uncharacterized protein n=1 Tax=Roseburia intestinalis L1-82 TaxID=536231 RepID=C7G5Z0_9FIRM|nr:hypothetical protein ROSINTL182_05299 [Roseburia intestinalis L1-82]